MMTDTETMNEPATSRQTKPIVPLRPFYDRDGITIYNADCRRILPFLDRFDLLLTDPPYGIGVASDGQVGGSKKAKCKEYGTCDWDKKPVDGWLLEMAVGLAEQSVVWGGNHYEMPPRSGWLVWHKKDTDCDFSDCELAWTSRTAGVRYFRHLWNGYWQQDMGNKEPRVHPTQKPVALMMWCLGMVPDAKTVLDPFMGSGTTLVAAKREGRQAVGIEINEEYCEVAAERLRQGVLF